VAQFVYLLNALLTLCYSWKLAGPMGVNIVSSITAVPLVQSTLCCLLLCV
jgi:hypothetical protein